MPTITVTAADAAGNTVSVPVAFTVARPTLAPAELGDGSNRSADLQAWLASLPNGSIADLGGMAIRADQTVTITGKTGLVVTNGLLFTDDPTGDGTTVANPSKAARTRAHWRLRACTDTTMSDCSVRGPNTEGGTGSAAYVAALEAQHAFDIGGGSSVVVHGGEQSYMYGDVVYFGGGVAGGIARGVHGHHQGRQGISATNATDVLIEGCNLHDIRRSCIDLEPATSAWQVKRVTIRDNDFGSHRLTWVASVGVGPVDDVTIADNRLTCPANVVATPPLGTRRSNWQVLRNTSTVGYGSPGGAVMTFARIDGVLVADNAIPAQAGRDMYLVRATDCTAVDVHGNTVPGGVGQLQPAA